MNYSVEKILEASGEAAEAFGAVMADVFELKFEDEPCFELSDKIQGTKFSLLDLQARMDAVFGLINGLPMEVDLSVVPNSFCTEIFNHLQSARASISKIGDAITQINDGEGIQKIEKDTLAVETRGADGTRHEFGSHFKQIWIESEDLLINYYRITQIAEGKGIADFSGLVTGFAVRMKEIEERTKSLQELCNSAAEAKNYIDQIGEDLKSHEDEAKRIILEAANDRKSISEYLGEVTANQAEITNVHKAAVSLKEQVTSYQGDFDAFQKQLNSREEAIQIGRAELDNLLQKI